MLILDPIAIRLLLPLLSAIRQAGAKPDGQAPAQLEPSFKRMMVYLFVGTRGGRNRAKIVEFLSREPSNLNQVSERLSLDYKTVQHHVKLLEENGVVVPSEKGAYGAVYFLTPYFERNFQAIRSMWG